MKSFIGVAAATVSLAVVPYADGATITFDNVTAVWSDGTPEANVTYTGNNTGFASANWGVPTPQSGYDFEGAAPPQIDVVLPPSPSGDFIIGEFTHRNNPINSGTSITDIRLTVFTDVYVDAVFQGNFGFVFDFIHNETPNSANPCADGGTDGSGVNVNGCADSVTFVYNNSLSESFDVGGTLYTMTLRGFLVGGSPVTTFWTTERLTNSADLVAYATTLESLQAAPEPATMLLLGGGLLGLAARRRRRQ